MAITETHSGNPTVTTSEYFCASASTTATYQTTDGVCQAFFDVSAMAAGDEYQFRAYEKVRSSSTARVVAEWVLSGAQAEPVFPTPSLILLHGWEFSIKKLAGTDRAIEFSIRSVA